MTIDGPWLGTNTIVKSKIGRCGEYRHALAKTIAIYSGNTYDARRLLKTVVYGNPSDATVSNEEEDDASDTPQSMSNEEIYEKITKPWINKVTSMGTKNKAALRSATSLAQRVDILLMDLVDRRHFDVLHAYDRHDISPPEFIQSLEATDELVKLAMLGNSEKKFILQRLLAKAGTPKTLSDPQRAAVIFTVERVSNEEDVDFVSRFLSSLKHIISDSNEYSNHYAGRLRGKFISIN